MTQIREPSLTLVDFGSMFVGGHAASTQGEPIEEVVLAANGVPIKIDPNGTTMVGHMYAQYAVPAGSEARPPILFWHGGSMTGAAWETTPDGRDGWFAQFLRRGWTCYNVDAVERGRSGWAPRDSHFSAPPILRTLQDTFTQFRLGRPVTEGTTAALEAAAYPDSQFPLADFHTLMHQIVPRWSATDDLTLDAYCALLQRVGPAIIIAHSQGGAFALRAAERCPDKVAAIVLVEPAQGGTTDGAALAGIPVLAVYGDHLDRDQRWPKIRARTETYFDAVRQCGGRVEILDLPEHGIAGNSHLLMMERNNAEIADRIAAWLEQLDLKTPSSCPEEGTHA